MGIVNVTPDSFSDGGHFHSPESAIAQAEKLISDGADILDIGGESTRPYADPVSLDEELNRTVPLIEAIRSSSDIPISIDTTKTEVARKALAAGADVINDISALRKEPEMAGLVAESGKPVIIMHMQGTPADMQDRPQYDNVLDEITAFFEERLEAMARQGIPEELVTLDPGIGFGKTLEHNLRIIKNLAHFKTLGRPILLGHSRKSFIAPLTGIEDAASRDLPTAVISALSVASHVDIVRVHNVAATRQALQVAEALRDLD
jgi:dihydropteroate synthase